MLYVAFDDFGRCLVSRDDPAPGGTAQRADYDGVVVIRLSGNEGNDRARTAPDLAGTRLLTGSILAIVAGATVTASALINPLLMLPVGAAAAVYVGRRHNAAAAGLERRWAERHRMLATRPEVARFRKGFDAARTILVAWPFLADLVQIPSPRGEVAASLWTLAGLLSEHADLAEQHAALNDARLGALPPEAPVRAALEERLALVERSQQRLSAEIDRRLESLTTLAARCAGFVREESALHAAHEAVRRADESLHRLTPPEVLTHTPDEAQELAERTTAIISAYRELR
ncbi:hypothetical protein AB0M46_30170 [Dactylosporangium sp. NPDC051485]|uniref:hypothetical protein n=1 Tax=Dactylosporangium sp. NPDC051485 TaxID=3154846 RepID=UPI003449D995